MCNGIAEIFDQALAEYRYCYADERTLSELRDFLIRNIKTLFNNPSDRLFDGLTVEFDPTRPSMIQVEFPMTCVEFAEAMSGKPIEEMIIQAEVAGDSEYAEVLQNLPRADLRTG